MMTCYKYFLSCFLIIGSWFCFGQDSKIDSLLKVLATVKEDTSKIDALNSLFLEYEFSDETKAQEYVNKAFALAQKIGFKRGLAETYLYLGYFAEDKGNYPEALKNYKASLKINEELKNKMEIANSFNNIGIIYKEQGNYGEALKNYFASLKIRKAINDKRGIAASYNSIGNIFYLQGNYPEALKHYFISLKIREEIADKQEIANSYNNIGTVYGDQGNYTEALKNHFACLKIKKEIGNRKAEAISYSNIGIVYYSLGDYAEAEKNHLASMKIREEIGDKKGFAHSCNNLGTVYSVQAVIETDPGKRKLKFDQALKSLFASLKIKEEIGDKIGIAGSYSTIGDVYVNQKKYTEAKEYLLISKKLSEEIGYKKNLKETYRNLTSLDSATGNFKDAYENHKLYILYSDSLDNEETRKKTIQSQMTYDFEKKEAVANAEHQKELEKQELIATEKSRKQKVVILFVVCGLILVIVFAGFIFRSLRITRKQKDIIEQQKSIVEQQKLEVEQQKIIVEEHQKEIIDSITYARRIQRSLLPTEKYINKNLNRLKNKN